MNQIGKVIEQKLRGTRIQQTSSGNTQVCVIDKEKFGRNISEMICRYNPDMQVQAASNIEESYMSEYPTLAQIKTLYGPGAAVAWLIPQITNYSEYCGKDGKLSKLQIECLANTISIRFSYLKISELMIFFFNLKSGKYGKIYGKNIDPVDICVNLQSFVKHERNVAIESFRAKENEQMRDRTAEEKSNSQGWRTGNIYLDIPE